MSECGQSAYCLLSTFHFLLFHKQLELEQGESSRESAPWRALTSRVELYFTVALFVYQYYPVCSFGKFISFGLQLSGVKGLKVIKGASYNVHHDAKPMCSHVLSCAPTYSHVLPRSLMCSGFFLSYSTSS